MTTTSPFTGRPDPDRLDDDAWSAQVARMDPADLRQLALSLPVIEQAKGMLMGHYRCDAATAFTILRRWSSTRSLRLRDVAAALVEEASHDERGRADGLPPSAVERFVNSHGLG